MGILGAGDAYRTIQVSWSDDVCRIRIHRPEAHNTINGVLIEECARVVDLCRQQAKILILEGSADIFCLGADFAEMSRVAAEHGRPHLQDPEPLYELWRALAFGPYISIAHVRGKVNAGGMGFVAACDLVLSEEKAVFSLSELLFGVLPACVLPFLARRIGIARANFMTLTAQPIGAVQAREWGLVDACEDSSENLLRKNLVRLKRLTKPAIATYKRYAGSLDGSIVAAKSDALRANAEAFSHPGNLENIERYVRTGRFPWEVDRSKTSASM